MSLLDLRFFSRFALLSFVLESYETMASTNDHGPGPFHLAIWNSSSVLGSSDLRNSANTELIEPTSRLSALVKSLIRCLHYDAIVRSVSYHHAGCDVYVVLDREDWKAVLLPRWGLPDAVQALGAPYSYQRVSSA